MGKKGTDAAFQYDPGSGTVTFNLAWPLERAPRGQLKVPTRKRRWVRDALDYSSRQVFTVGSAVREIKGPLRFEDDIAGLLNFIESGLDGVEVTYFPDLGAGTPSFPSWLIGTSPSLAEIRQDPDRYAFGEYTIEIHLRHSQGGDFNALL